MTAEGAAERGPARRGGPLQGVRVLDLTHMLSGPYCTWILAGLGSDVIKVERPGGGDFAREIEPFSGGASLYFQSVNRGKRSIALDLKSSDDRELLLELATNSDVFVENNRPGVMSRLGLGYENIRERNRRIVYASISGFGQTGPYASRPAFDTVIQAMSGLMSITGDPDGAPTRVGASIADIGAGLFAAVGILAALNEARSTGNGRFLDVSMLDAQLAILENAAARYLNTGVVPLRVGNRHPLVTPFQTFETSDHPVVVCCDTQAQWSRFCAVLGLPNLPSDPRFKTGPERTRNHAALEPILGDKMRERPSAAWLEAFLAADVPAASVNTIAEILNDPHVRARGMVVDAGPCRFVDLPLFQTGDPQRPAPALDEHGDEIRSELRRYTDTVPSTTPQPR